MPDVKNIQFQLRPQSSAFFCPVSGIQSNFLYSSISFGGSHKEGACLPCGIANKTLGEKNRVTLDMSEASKEKSLVNSEVTLSETIPTIPPVPTP